MDEVKGLLKREQLGLGRDDVFKVETKESFSFFNTENEAKEKVLAHFTDFKYEGRFVNVEVSENRGGGRRSDRSSGGRRDGGNRRDDRRSGGRRDDRKGASSGNRSDRRRSEGDSKSPRRSDSSDIGSSRPRRSRR